MVNVPYYGSASLSAAGPGKLGPRAASLANMTCFLQGSLFSSRSFHLGGTGPPHLYLQRKPWAHHFPFSPFILLKFFPSWFLLHFLRFRLNAIPTSSNLEALLIRDTALISRDRVAVTLS